MEAELVEAGPEEAELEVEAEAEAETEAASMLGGEEALRVACSKQMALLALMERTGYSMVQENGQRKYGGPPPGWEGPPPPRGCEVFVGKIPRDMFEDELVPIFQRAGAIYELRLMMEFSGENRGYAFVMFTSREAARRAIQTLDNQQVRPGKFIGVCSSRDNCRLFIGSIPNDKSRQEIQDEVSKVTEGVADVIVYQSAMDRSRNRGFAFIEYESHKAAAMARKKLIPGNLQLWGQTVQVDWAEPEKDVDEEVMQRVKVLFVRNFSPLSSEERLHREFSRCRPGSVERVKMMHSYAFVHFRSREDALAALCLMDGARVDGAVLEVSLARPAWVKERCAARKRPSGSREGETLNDDEGAALMARLGDSHSPPPPLLPPPPPTARSPVFKGGSDVFPLGPGTPLAPAGLLSVRHTQMRSAVSVLDLYCSIKYGAPPTYQLLATPTRHRSPLLVYKVCIPQTGSAFMPDRLCLMLEDAKELAAQTALRSLDWYL